MKYVLSQNSEQMTTTSHHYTSNYTCGGGIRTRDSTILWTNIV